MPCALNLLRIGNAQGFWGDSVDAPARLVAQQPDLDCLTLDYLAEVSLSILAIQREKDPSAGYARDFVEVVRSLAPAWKKGSRVKIVTNAGGLNPEGCACACRDALQKLDCGHLKIWVVEGDDVLPVLKECADDPSFRNLETGRPLRDVLDRLVTANAYVGAEPIVMALKGGADLVITGRVADPSLTAAPCIAHHGWSFQDYDRIAGATIAGHLIECGTQATGGFSTDWLSIPGRDEIGFPVVEVGGDGSCIVTKPAGTGGRVSVMTVKEQLLYEIGDPGNYLSPDATVSFLRLLVKQEGKDRVRVAGAIGRPPPPGLKVSATYRDGFRASGMLTIYGRDAVKKARQAGAGVLRRVERAGFKLERTLVECLGAGASVAGVKQAVRESDLLETVLRVSVADPRREAVERFTKEMAPLVTCGPQGVTGYAVGRPKVLPVFGYWPCLIPKDRVKPSARMIS